MVYAVQWKGNNLAELQEFAPEKTFQVREGNVLWITPPPPNPALVCNLNEWLMDDPYIGQLSVITDTAFKQRFDPSPVP